MNKPMADAQRVITQRVNQGRQREATAEDERAEAALAALEELVAGNFGGGVGGSVHA